MTGYKLSVDDSNKVSSTKEDGSKFYFAVGKGTYSELEISVTINVNGDYEHNTTSVVKFPNADLSQYAGYTINIDLASAEEPEVEEPLFSAPSADDEEGSVDFETIGGTFDYDFDSDYPSVPQYRLTMRDTDSVTFETAPESATVKTLYYETGFFGDSSETETEFTLVDGKLTISNFEEERGTFRIYIYTDGDEVNPAAIIAITYTHTSKGDDGESGEGEGDEDSLLKLAPGSSATLRATTSEDKWYVNDGAATEQFTVTTSSRYLYFSKFIDYESFELAEDDATTYNGYFSSVTSQVPEGQTGFDILGSHYSESSAEYTVYFSDQWDVYVRLHIIYNAE